VLDGVRQTVGAGYRSRTLTPEGPDRGTSWAATSQDGEHDFSKHLAPASPVGDPYRASKRVATSRLQESGTVLQHCSNLCLSEVAQRLTPVVFEEGEIVIKQRQVGRAMFFIESGSLQISVNGQEVRQVSGGECFGEVALTISEFTSAQVKAVSKSELLELQARDLWHLFAVFPELYATLKHHALENVNRACAIDMSLVQAAWGDVAAEISPARAAFDQLLQSLEEPLNAQTKHNLMNQVFFAPHQCIVQGFQSGRSGTSSNSLYFIDHGEVRVTHKGVDVARLRAGDYFGEVALLVSQATMVSVYAVTCVELFEVKAADMWRLLNASTRLYNVLLRKATLTISRHPF
jgi:CRP-like cAMP-binding protein